ncbi:MULTISPECIES: histidine phosphatase family protein [Solibacillus]|uniref:histidine phosphatase family protein n=1 Tax=Solibacillus TaxID=648800 RepID=UPI00203C2C33|nr:histidine phosphatase family protein [Solibacillus isronensis]MCM3721640.1 histidine phosphatase family protein [Solibacillus isronensis]
MKLYIIRHAESEGQDPKAKLTVAGKEESEQLANFLEQYPIELVISSPFTRALHTIEPFVRKNKIPFKIDHRLRERLLSDENLPDWLEKLKQTYVDKDLKFTGGESSNEAIHRINELVEELKQSAHMSVVIVTHGNIMSLLLNHFQRHFGFDDWKQLSNPDVFEIEFSNEQTVVNRVWR